MAGSRAEDEGLRGIASLRSPALHVSDRPRKASGRGGRLGLRSALLALALAAPAFAADRTPQSNYLLRCSGCHRPDGTGQADAGIPPFQDSVGAFAGSERGRLYLLHVPGVPASSLSDAEIAAVLNHVMARFAGTSRPSGAAPFEADEVARLRAVEVKDVVALRRELVAEFAERGIEVADDQAGAHGQG